MRRYLAYSVIVVVSFAIAFYFKPSRPLEFASVADAKERIERTGLWCVVFHEHTSPSIVISDSQITIDDAIDFYASNSAKTNGMVLIVMNRNAETDPSPSNRVWGKVLALGDSRVLRIIESKTN